MHSSTRAYWRGLFTVVGTTIGVGIFGVPYIMAQPGFLIGMIHIAVIGALLIMLNLMYAEVVLHTADRQQFVGIVRTWFGVRGGHVATFVSILSFLAALLAYTIIAGEFLHLLLGSYLGIGGSALLYSILFAVIGTIIIGAGVHILTDWEERLTIALIVAVGVIALISVPYITTSNYAFMDLARAVSPYGVVLFALSAVSMIPLLEEQVGGEKKLVSKVIVHGGVIAMALTALFSAVVLGVTGTTTTPEALSGLAAVVGAPALIIGTIFGLLAIATSYLVFGDNTKKVLEYDYNFPGWLSLLLATGVPLLIYLLGTRDFITVIDASGSVFGGMMGIIVVHVFNRARRGVHLDKPIYRVPYAQFWSVVLYAVFSLGIIYQLMQKIG